MEAGRYINILRRGWLVLVIALIVGLLAGFGITSLQEPQYRAKTTVYLSVANAETTSELNQGGNYASTAAKTYAKIAGSPIVLGKVKSSLGLDASPEAIGKWVTTDVELNTQLITIAVVNGDPKVAADVANSIAEQLTKTVSELSPTNEKNTEMLKVTVTAPAVTPQFPFAPSLKLGMALAGIAALGLAVVFIVLRDILDTRIRNEEVLASVLKLPILASVPDDPEGNKSGTVLDGGKTARSESFRQLRTNLQYIDYSGGLRSLVVTSPNTGEGKTTTAIHLAETTTALGVTVLLIDADLRRPRIHEALGIEGSVGLSTVLAGLADPREVVQQFGPSGMYVLPAGHVPPNPSELLGSQSMAQLLNELCDIFDLVILDAAPVLPVTDPTVLSMLTDGAVLVVNAKKTTRASLERTANTLKSAGVTLLGTVLNMAPGKSSAYYEAPRAGDDSTKRWIARRNDTKAHKVVPPSSTTKKPPTKSS